MSRGVVLFIYNLLLPFVFILAFPGWVIKMRRRGGFGTGLLQRLAIFEDNFEVRKGGVYVHAVSVGETLIALKLIKKWQEMHPDEHFILVPTTATGHEVARKHISDKLNVIYSPVDFPFLVKKVMKKFEPKQVVLIEGEMWPNLLNVCRKLEIPVGIANARLSKRSESRYLKFAGFVKPILSMLSQVCVQEKEDVKRWVSLGVNEVAIVHTGSIKFDYEGGAKPRQREEFSQILAPLTKGKKIVMVISTFPGEEKLIARELKDLENIYLVFVPRHMERRLEVFADLSELGMLPVLRSELGETPENSVMIIDSTGELRDWTAHADLVIVGKSWLSKGGQNPTEAIAALVPVIVGKRMDNFEPLVGTLVENEAIVQLELSSEIKGAVESLLNDNERVGSMVMRAKDSLMVHSGATKRTVEVF